MVWELSQNESLSPANCRDIHLFAKHSGAALERGEENIIAIFPKVGQHKYCHFLAQYVTGHYSLTPSTFPPYVFDTFTPCE